MVLKNKKFKKTVSILGSTGSIGKSTIDLIMRNPETFDIVALTAQTNVKILAQQARIVKPNLVVIGDHSKYKELKNSLLGTNIEVASGKEALNEAAGRKSDWTMVAIVGIAGLLPTIQAIKNGQTIALANKECLVSAGEIFNQKVSHYNAIIIPVDSEHNAIFQVFDFKQKSKVRKIILTASGGPFRTTNINDMRNITVTQALKHPNWSMGSKISIDSATMMNKGLELIEAYYLFPVNKNAIEILVHPQSIIHSMVDYVDGSVLAQLGTPDMRTPIAYSLAWPERIKTPVKQLSLSEIGELTFEAPDTIKFPALSLAREALNKGGFAPTVLNAANEVAVKKFLEGKIKFLDIVKTIEKTLEKLAFGAPNSIDDILLIDQQARNHVNSITK